MSSPPPGHCTQTQPLRPSEAGLGHRPWLVAWWPTGTGQHLGLLSEVRGNRVRNGETGNIMGFITGGPTEAIVVSGCFHSKPLIVVS